MKPSLPPTLQSSPQPASRSDPRPASSPVERVVYTSIIALALGLIPVLALSDAVADSTINTSRVVICAVLAAAALASLALVRTGRPRAAALLLVAVVWLASTVYAFYTGFGLHTSVIWLYLPTILYASLLLGSRAAVGTCGATLAALYAMWLAEATGRIGGMHAFMQGSTALNYLLGVMVTLLACLAIAIAYRRAMERTAVALREEAERREQAYRELEGSRRELELMHAEMVALNAGLEQRVAERTRELENTVKELESFNYSVSHDLRAPLRAINGYASILNATRAAALDPEARHLLGRVAAEAQRMDELLMALLGLGRIGQRRLEPETLDFSALADEVAGELALTPDGKRTQFVVQPGLRARGDRVLLRTLLAGLMGNATKFSRGSAMPRVEVGRTETARGSAYFVEDNGAGFDPAYASQLFKPFHRLHGPGEFEGLGMGLAGAHRVIERHGGEIWAEARQGAGAGFYFTLPA